MVLDKLQKRFMVRPEVAAINQTIRQIMVSINWENDESKQNARNELQALFERRKELWNEYISERGNSDDKTDRHRNTATS